MRYCILVAACIAVSGCGLLFGSYDEKPLEYVEIYESAGQVQQVRILSRVNPSGGAHNPFDASHQTYISSTWVPLEGTLFNKWRCPLTSVAARYTSDRRPNFDIYLPEWLAEHNKLIFGALYVAGVAFAFARWVSAPQ